MDESKYVRSIVTTILIGGDSILLSSIGRKPGKAALDFITKKIVDRLGLSSGVASENSAVTEIAEAESGKSRVTATQKISRKLSVERVLKAYQKLFKKHEREIIALCPPTRSCSGCPHFEPYISYEGIHDECVYLDEDPDCRCPNNQFRTE
ncbi:MAG: hypothetical protein NUW37_02250 [Planctomycetes bacterium]|nr:hypothetical protein [Planctomycetota bacterium]